MTQNKILTQICVVVHDVKQVSSNWAKVLGLPEASIATVFPDGILHYTDGVSREYRDLQVAKYELDNIILELLQPGKDPSPWRTFLEEHGQGVFHFCIFVTDRRGFQQTLTEVGIPMPYHIGYHPYGSYSYVHSREQLGLELSVNLSADYSDLMKQLTAGLALPFDELK